jgi:hypothetical protein
MTSIFILIPFFFVDEILTRTEIKTEIVWCNNTENLTTHIRTIPIEDTFNANSVIH